MTGNSKANDHIRATAQKLLAYCRSNDWAGYDPYDALNSRLFKAVPVLDSRVPRLVLTQALKRLPVNFRPLLAIPATQNPKGLALFLSSFIKLSGSGAEDDRELETLIAFMVERLSSLRSSKDGYARWGYSFPWQTRTKVVPSGTPNLVCTTFAANALFDAFDWSGDTRCLNLALSAAEYLVNELYWTEGSVSGFSYPLPSIRNQVHNANFLAAALLGRAYSRTNDERFLLPSLNVARYSAKQQDADGSWQYGEAKSQNWIDNFHTGFNLCALRALSKYVPTSEFDTVIGRGFEFYRHHFLGADGVARYFHDRTYPIDIHSVAQSIITLVTFKDLDAGNLPLAHSVLNWALAHMWDDRGFFYYRVLRSHTNRISYMRWSQAWMLLALATLLEASEHDNIAGDGRRLIEVGLRAHA
jgi:hypothetical protein